MMVEQAIAVGQKQADAAKEEPKPIKRQIRRRSAKKQERLIVVKSKRKSAIARAYVKPGKGTIRINGNDIMALELDSVRHMVMEPIIISGIARENAKKLDIKINVKGGGVSSQQQAIKGVIAKAIVEFSKSESLKKEYMDYDRTLLVDDSRRVEPKKFRGPKARARFQTSYR